MPLGREDMESRRVKEEELVDQINEDMIEEVYTKDFKPRKIYAQTLSRMMEVREVFDKFPNKSIVPALEFEEMFQDSIWSWPPPKVNRIKKMMGITSIRKDGKWWWTRPTDPTAASYQKGKKTEMQRNAIKQLNKKLHSVQRPAARKLLSIMKEHGYDAPPDAVLYQMDMSRGTVIRCKSSLGILSWKDKEGDGRWHWVYLADEVSEWFIKELQNPAWLEAKVPREYIWAKAWEEKRWSKLLFELILPRNVDRGVGRTPSGELFPYYRLKTMRTIQVIDGKVVVTVKGEDYVHENK